MNITPENQVELRFEAIHLGGHTPDLAWYGCLKSRVAVRL